MISLICFLKFAETRIVAIFVLKINCIPCRCRSTGFILEGFPRNVDEAKYLSTNGLFPDGTILLAVEDTAIVERLLPPKLEKWKKKRDRRLVEKERKKELAKKLKVS